MSLRASLEQRAARPRRLTARLVKPGREADAERLARHREILALLEVGKDPEAAATARQTLDRAVAEAGEYEDVVEFRALPPADFEALVFAHTDDQGDVDEAAMRAQLFAVCATDPDLQDEAWWSEHLADATFTSGQVKTLWRVCWEVNAGAAGIGGPLPD